MEATAGAAVAALTGIDARIVRTVAGSISCIVSRRTFSHKPTAPPAFTANTTPMASDQCSPNAVLAMNRPTISASQAETISSATTTANMIICVKAKPA